MNCAVCEAVLEQAASFYNQHPLCQACADAAVEYAHAREARVERLEDRAARKAQEAHDTTQRARVMAQAIPFGQPILVGHHSEGRDRRYRARIENTFRKGAEAQQEAARMADRAQAARKHGDIDATDPLALLKLADKIATAEAAQERMKAANKVIRGHTSFLPGDSLLAALGLIELGFSEAQATRLLDPDFAGRRGFPDYSLRNNNANIRRMKTRLEELRALRVAVATEPEPEPNEIAPGVDVVRNVAENRLQLLFDGKPDADTRAVLKAGGWRWAPSHGAWQRHLNANSEWALEQFTAWLAGRP